MPLQRGAGVSIADAEHKEEEKKASAENGLGARLLASIVSGLVNLQVDKEGHSDAGRKQAEITLYHMTTSHRTSEPRLHNLTNDRSKLALSLEIQFHRVLSPRYRSVLASFQIHQLHVSVPPVLALDNPSHPHNPMEEDSAEYEGLIGIGMASRRIDATACEPTSKLLYCCSRVIAGAQTKAT